MQYVTLLHLFESFRVMTLRSRQEKCQINYHEPEFTTSYSEPK